MAFALLIATVAAIQAAPAASPATTAQAVDQHFGRSFMSPMGEPFFGRTPAEDGLTAWFEQADRNQDGAITSDEMRADAERFFRALDSDRDGEIGPDEITRYESQIAPQVRNPAFHGAQPVDAAVEGKGSRHHRRGGAYGGIGGDDEAGAGRYGLLQIPEPVTSADTDLNRGVSAAEFEAAAAKRFQLLDVGHTGRLTLAQLVKIRAAAASAARRPRHDKSDQEVPLDPNADTGG
jgi:Ca2+-binding EF-hand superfamily protein